MNNEKSIASIRLAIKLNDEYIWIKPDDLYEIGQFGEWHLFLYMDRNSEIVFYAGKEENRYRQIFS